MFLTNDILVYIERRGVCTIGEIFQHFTRGWEDNNFEQSIAFSIEHLESTKKIRVHQFDDFKDWVVECTTS